MHHARAAYNAIVKEEYASAKGHNDVDGKAYFYGGAQEDAFRNAIADANAQLTTNSHVDYYRQATENRATLAAMADEHLGGWELTAEAIAHPGDGLIGMAKGAVNGVSDLAELTVGSGMRYGARKLSEVGFGGTYGSAILSDAAAEDYFGTWKPTNDAQRGGADMAVLAEVALTMGAGAAKRGSVALARRAAQQGDAIQNTLRATNPIAALNDARPVLSDLRLTTSAGGMNAVLEVSEAVVTGYRVRKALISAKGLPPAWMEKPHAHHVVFKKGNGSAQQALVQEGQAILRKYDIDPIYGPENLIWAPNAVRGQHSIDALRPLVEELTEASATGASKNRILEILDKYGEIAAKRVKNDEH